MSIKIFISSSSNDLKGLSGQIAKTLKSHADVWCDESHNIEAGDNWHEFIHSRIASCDTVLLIVGGDHHRSNVLYEAGMATGAGKQVILIAAANTGIPSPLRNYPVIFFDPFTIYNEETASSVCQSLEHFTWQSSRRSPRGFSSALNAFSEMSGRAKDLEKIDPLGFEKLVMNMLQQIGWHIHQSSSEFDAGYDFRACLPSLKDCELLVECKKLSAQKMVGMEPLFKLANAVRLSGDTLGLLVTTAPLTASAEGFLRETKDRLMVLQLSDLVSDPDQVELFCKRSLQERKTIQSQTARRNDTATKA